MGVANVESLRKSATAFLTLRAQFETSIGWLCESNTKEQVYFTALQHVEAVVDFVDRFACRQPRHALFFDILDRNRFDELLNTHQDVLDMCYEPDYDEYSPPPRTPEPSDVDILVRAARQKLIKASLATRS